MSEIRVNTIDTKDNTSLTIQQNNNTAITIDTSQNVGIGTSSPSSPLHIAKSGTGIWFQTERTDAGGFFTISHNSQKTYFNTEQDYIWSINGTEAMRINSSGNVGIGTSSPLYQFDVGNGSGSKSINIFSGSSDIGALYFTDSTSGTGSYIGRLAYDHSSDAMLFTTNTTERMRIDSSGRVKIGTVTTANHILHTEYNTNSYLIKHQNSHTSTPFGMQIEYPSASPDNNDNQFFACTDSTTNRLIIWADGDVDNHDNSYSGFSDEKLKEQITDASSQWNDIKNLRVRKFKFKSDVATGDSDEHWRLGVIAQELETVSPHLVSEKIDRDAEMNDLGTTTKSVKYSILYMKAVKALQEAMQKIEDLEARVDTLEGN